MWTRGVLASTLSREAAGASVAGVVPPGLRRGNARCCRRARQRGACGAPACWLVCVAGSGAWLFGAKKYWKPNRITQETTIARMRFF